MLKSWLLAPARERTQASARLGDSAVHRITPTCDPRPERAWRPLQGDEARKLPNTNFVVHSRFREFALRDGRLVTGQQQFSGAAAARLTIEALGL